MIVTLLLLKGLMLVEILCPSCLGLMRRDGCSFLHDRGVGRSGKISKNLLKFLSVFYVHVTLRTCSDGN